MQNRGFTLLELLVVLTLIGLIAGMVGPRFIDMAERMRDRNEWLQLQQLINELPIDAQQTSKIIEIGPKGSALPLPKGWGLRATRPIRYLANGICLGGELLVLREGEIARRVQLDAPYCQWQGRP